MSKKAQEIDTEIKRIGDAIRKHALTPQAQIEIAERLLKADKASLEMLIRSTPGEKRKIAESEREIQLQEQRIAELKAGV